MNKKFLGFFLLCLLCFSGKVFGYSDSVETRINLWPLFTYSKEKKSPEKEVTLFGPLVLYERELNFKKLSLRPFYTSITRPNKKEAFFLSPLGHYKKEPFYTFFGIAPIIFSKTRQDPFTGNMTSYTNILILFWGKAPNGEKYGGLFPLFGVFKDKFATKKITFFLWPLYTKVEYPEYNSTNILWPIFRFVYSKNGKYSGFKIFPFYAHYKMNGIERKFILWPFYIKEKATGKEQSYFSKTIVFPFFAKEKTRYSEKTVILWPFFKILKKKNPYYEEYDTPWPFLVRIKGKEVKAFKLWPLYTYTHTSTSKDYCIMWPFYCYESDSIQRGGLFFEKKEVRFLVVSKFGVINENGKRVEKHLKFWPFIFWNAMYSANGSVSYEHWYFPYLIPIKNRGVEQNYVPLLKLIDVKKTPNRFKLNLLWGLFTVDKKKNRTVTELAFLFREVKDKKHHTFYIELLQGLLGIGKVDGKKVCKVLFVNLCGI